MFNINSTRYSLTKDIKKMLEDAPNGLYIHGERSVIPYKLKVTKFTDLDQIDAGIYVKGKGFIPYNKVSAIEIIDKNIIEIIERMFKINLNLVENEEVNITVPENIVKDSLVRVYIEGKLQADSNNGLTINGDTITFTPTNTIEDIEATVLYYSIKI